MLRKKGIATDDLVILLVKITLIILIFCVSFLFGVLPLLKKYIFGMINP